MNYLVILMHYNVRGDINESLNSNWGRSHDAGLIDNTQLRNYPYTN